MRIIKAVIFFIGFSAALTAQDTTSNGFVLSFGAGIYYSGHETAEYYNGRVGGRLTSVLQFREAEIRDALGGYNFKLEDYANDMSYRSSAYFELQLGYKFNENWKVNINFMNVKLDANGIYTLRVEKTNQGNPLDPVLEEISIIGREKRSHIELGLQYIISLNNTFYTPIEAGYDIAFIEVLENRFRINNKDFAINRNTDIRIQGEQLTTTGSSAYFLSGIGLRLPSEYKLLLQFKYLYGNIDVEQVYNLPGSIFTASVLFSKRF